MSDQLPDLRDDAEDIAIPLELHCVVVMEDEDGNRLDFEVVGIVEEEINGTCEPTYAVCYNEDDETFLVTDIHGNPIEEEEIIDLIMEDYKNLSPADEED